MSRFFNDDGFDDQYIEDDELYHFGIMGQKWGLRRFQNKDGSLTPEGKMRYLKTDSSVTKRVKRDWNTMSDKEFKNKYAASKKTYLKRVKKYGDPYMNSPLAKTGKKLYAIKNKRAFTDKDAIKEVEAVAVDKGKKFKFDKNLAVKSLAALAVTAAGAAAIHKLMREDAEYSNYKEGLGAGRKASSGPKVTSDSLQKNFSNAFDVPKGPTGTVGNIPSWNRYVEKRAEEERTNNFRSTNNQNSSNSGYGKKFSDADKKRREAYDFYHPEVAKKRDEITKRNSDFRKKTYSENAKRQFEDSVKTARNAGVPEDKILKTKKDIDNYFNPGNRMSSEEFDKGMSDRDNTLVFDDNGMHFEKRKK